MDDVMALEQNNVGTVQSNHRLINEVGIPNGIATWNRPNGLRIGDQMSYGCLDRLSPWSVGWGRWRGWRAIGASAIGLSHLLREEERQDAFSIRAHGEWLAVAVSDGLGTRAHADIGSATCVYVATAEALLAFATLGHATTVRAERRPPIDEEAERQIVARHSTPEVPDFVETSTETSAGDNIDVAPFLWTLRRFAPRPAISLDNPTFAGMNKRDYPMGLSSGSLSFLHLDTESTLPAELTNPAAPADPASSRLSGQATNLPDGLVGTTRDTEVVAKGNGATTWAHTDWQDVDTVFGTDPRLGTIVPAPPSAPEARPKIMEQARRHNNLPSALVRLHNQAGERVADPPTDIGAGNQTFVEDGATNDGMVSQGSLSELDTVEMPPEPLTGIPNPDPNDDRPWEEWREALRGAITRTREEMKRHLSRDQGLIGLQGLDQISCTLLLLVIHADTGVAFAAQVGDGYILGCGPDGGPETETRLVQPVLGGAANQAYAVTQDKWDRVLTMETTWRTGRACDTFVLITDGVADEIGGRGGNLSDGLRDFCGELARETDTRRDDAVAGTAWLDWLSNYTEGSTDDRTLVILRRPTTTEAPPGVEAKETGSVIGATVAKAAVGGLTREQLLAQAKFAGRSSPQEGGAIL